MNEPFQLKPCGFDADIQVQRYLHFWATASDAEKQAVLDADKRRKEEADHDRQIKIAE